jgi:hypothetical protein
MKKLGKLSINPEKNINSDGLLKLKGGSTFGCFIVCDQYGWWQDLTYDCYPMDYIFANTRCEDELEGQCNYYSYWCSDY